MKLIIREYLSLLKESEELDSLLSDLLFNMDIEPISKPQRGARQYGVDLAGVGIDPEDRVKKVFLFVIKQKNIDRSSWDTGSQAVRPSLNEIFDVYLKTMLDASLKVLPKKIIVATNGDLVQAVQINWKNYTDEKSIPGEIEIDFWGGDKLALLIQENLYNEFLFPKFAQSYIRKTLAFIDMNDYDMLHFNQLIEEALFQNEIKHQKDHLKVLRLLHLTLNLIFIWSTQANNLKPAFLAAERVTLRIWDWLKVNEFLSNDSLFNEFLKIESTRFKVSNMYFNKIQKHCYVQDGLSGYGAEEIEYPLVTFDQIGILGTIGIDLIYKAIGNEEERNQLIKYAEVTADALINLIKNNKSSYYPLYDGHITDIGLGLLFLFMMEKKTEMAHWLDQLINYLLFNFQFKKRFPILSDSYDDLIEIQLGEIEQEVTSTTLLPILLEYCVLLQSEELYMLIKEGIISFFPNIDLQIWYPDETTEQWMYKENALHESGTMRSSIRLPENILDYKNEIVEEIQHQGDAKSFSFVSNGYPIVGLISSRHFRTPISPFYWRQFIPLESPDAEEQT